MPRIYIEWLEGRTKEQRQKIAEDITKIFVKHADLKPGDITIDFNEIPHEMHFKGGKN